MFNIRFNFHRFLQISGRSDPKPQYIISKMGKYMLIHDGSKYTQSGTPIISDTDTRTRWRCTFMSNGRYACKAKAFTRININGFETAEYYGVHCHGPMKGADEFGA